MPQKTNLNISPYYDDFDKADNFYKVLFKPGFPVQARELSGLQSILQNQVESFGSHMFKEGSMVIPGNIEYDSTYFSSKINPEHLGIDVSIYLDAIVANNDGKGTRVRGQNSQIVATIKNYIIPPTEGVDSTTIFVKYVESGSSSTSEVFPNGEILVLEENVTYGNTTLLAGETVLTLEPENASHTGSSFNVENGVYFIRGTFVDVTKSTLVLEPYNNRPSYRVGFEVLEQIINANDDPSLFDNAKGFTNYAAPGADRFKISVKLTKKSLDDFEDTNFVELLRIRDGQIKKIQDTSVYSEIKKYFAKRTFDESGNYSVNPFKVEVQNSLNDEIGSNGLYTEAQKTDEGNTPAEDLLCVKLSPGKAYVKGFDVSLPGTTVLDVEKPRDTKTIKKASIPFKMGSLLKVNNVAGTPWINIGGSNANTIGLYNQRKISNASNGIKIGDARVYSFSVSDAPYTTASTEFDLHLWDIQTYTTLSISNPGSHSNGTKVRGLTSGAIGYIADTPNTGEISLSQTTGTFVAGEVLIFNERNSDTSGNATSSSIIKINSYTTEDIKSVFQAQNAGSTGLVSPFSADAVLYDRILPNFSITDNLSVLGGAESNTASAAGRRFAGVVGIKTDAIISYNHGTFADPVFNRVSNISSDGETLTLVAVGQSITGVNNGGILAAGISTNSTFRIKSPKITNLSGASLYSRLPKKNISAVDLSDSNLVISRQITGKSVSGKTLTITSQDGLDVSSGISSAFFEPFDAEKYSIAYADGTTEPLTGDQVTITNNGNDVQFSGLAQNSNCTVNVTMKKIGLTSKSKDFVRSSQVQVTRTAGVSTLSTNLSPSDVYGIRVEDEEISLNVPDAVNILAVYESKDSSDATLDKLTFVSGLALDTNAVIGEKITGKASRAIAQVVSRTSTEIGFVYLNANNFNQGETVIFDESNIEATIQKITSGNYTNRTKNYTLDKGHRRQFSDYSRIVRRKNTTVPSKRLLLVFDYYKASSTENGDLYTSNSYTKERYSTDIPAVGRNRGTDILDFRPRVNPFDAESATASPFAFNSRTFESTTKYVVAPNESSILGYSYYLPRIDKLVINKSEQVKLIKGVSADLPAPPTEVGDSMEIAQITLPPYLYDPVKGPSIKMYDNRRFTMRDIASLERRIDNLEVMTSLTALELDTKSLQIKDADGLDRFKSGFVVNNFKNRDFINFNSETGSRCDVDVVNKELVSATDFWSMRAEIAFDPSIDVNSVDTSSNLNLLDSNTKKTGDLITLDYTEVDWINQPQATQVENINPFNVIVFVGGVILDPPSDNWTRTIYVDNFRTESTGATWAEQANIVSDNTTSVTDVDVTETEIEADQNDFDGNHTDITTTTTTTSTQVVETSFTNTLENAGREFDYVESIKISGATDPWMRSRNVAFAANGLKPFTKHYHYLDSGIPDLFPKLMEITMSSGTFNLYENVSIQLNGQEIGYVKSKAPDHKYGDDNVIAVPNGLGSPSTTVEKYSVDPFDRTRPAPSSTYSATSKLFNCDVDALSNEESYYGYVVVGAQLVGETSGAVAIVDSIDLISDNWGDLLGAFFFRDANDTSNGVIPTLFRTGTKTFRVTAATPGTIPLPGSTALASDASGVYSATGTILTQVSNTVGVRNPPPPAQKPNEITTSVNVDTSSTTRRIQAPYRDPLAQTFTTDETGAFLTSFDVYFASKDPNAKVFVELREVELGTPTSFLVQDYAQVALNPNDITTSTDASVATTIRFPSPVYLEPRREYAIVFLSPGSDLYEMWVATMGQKTVATGNLPDVQNVVVTKQYIGGSLFKSQNGTIWTPSQYQDLTFKLRKASFVPSGTATFYNTPIEAGNLNTAPLPENPIRSLPRKLKVPVNSLAASEAPPGRKISTGAVADAEDSSITGIVEAQGSAMLNVESGITTVSAGIGYSFTSLSASGSYWKQTGVTLKSLTGSGTGSTADVLVGVGGVVHKLDNLTAGSGYVAGEILTIDNDDTDVTAGSAYKVSVDSISSTLDTLYLTDVQGETFTNNDPLIHYGAENDTRTLASSSAKVSSDSTVNGVLNTGNIFEVIQYNHGHHGSNNFVSIKGVEPDTTIVQTTSELTVGGSMVSVGNTVPFATFAGITTDRGEALIGEEVVSYVVGTGQLTLDARGKLGTSAALHVVGSDIQTYEANGIPLVGINTTHDISTINANVRNSSGIDSYFLEVDRSAIDHTNQRVSGKAQMSFTSTKGIGGDNAVSTQNHQFSSFSPRFNVITPGKGTRASASVRTVSGTSASGSEVSFIDQGFEPTILNETTFFSTPRLAASKVNESQRLTTLPKNKSLTLKVDMTSDDPNLSPVLDVKNATFVLGRNKINSPIGVDNYATDNRTNKIIDDPHGSIFVSRRVNLKQPATSLKVLVGASVQPEADFRVFYRLFTADSSEVSQTYRAFPGYKNLIDIDGDGFGDEIIDINLNDGRADAKLESNPIGQFSEYQFSIDNLEQFSGFTIKIVMTSTNECVPVRLKDFRAIALA